MDSSSGDSNESVHTTSLHEKRSRKQKSKREEREQAAAKLYGANSPHKVPDIPPHRVTET